VTGTRRPSPQTAAVLQALAEDPDRWRYGYDLCTQLGLQPGSAYPILIRLADRGLLETSWETNHVPGRPARHLYRLTGPGCAYATSTAAAVTAGAAPAMTPSPATAPRRSRPRLGGV
jgi:PadR family transcriptional regulator, regulatory protein PadR